MPTLRRLPRHGSIKSNAGSLNLPESKIQRGVPTSVKQLEADIRTFIDLHNKNPKPFKWTKSADQIWLPSNASVTKRSRLYVANFRFG